MKKPLLLFACLLTAIVSFAAVAAREPVVSIATVIANQGAYVANYSSQFKLAEPGSALSWTAANFNNNNSAWNDIRCGDKSAATTATITTDFAIRQAIASVDVEISRYKTGSTNRMTSMALLVSPNADMSNAISYPADISGLPTTTGTPVTISIPIASAEENMFYRLSIEMPKVSSAGVFSVNSLKYFAPEKADEGSQLATLDFTEKESLLALYDGTAEIAPGSEYAATATNNLDGASFDLNAVEVTILKADGSIQPRWWESKTISAELRLNPDNVMTFDVVKDGYRLREVKFIQGNSDASYFSSLEATAVTNLGESVFSEHKWVAPEDDSVTSLTLTFSDYCRCGAIQVVYVEEDNEMSSIEQIDYDGESDEPPVEYFNLHGIRVSGDNAPSGIYIRRRGSSVSKIIIR